MLTKTDLPPETHVPVELPPARPAFPMLVTRADMEGAALVWAMFVLDAYEVFVLRWFPEDTQ